jgi:hypothetical protein
MDRIVKGLPQVGILPILNDAVKVAAARRRIIKGSRAQLGHRINGH